MDYVPCSMGTTKKLGKKKKKGGKNILKIIESM
jgi:hypothetical protein